MKNTTYVIFLVIIFFMGCKNNSPNTVVYKDILEITLPPKFYIRDSQIYDKKNNKIGEMPWKIHTPLRNISFSEYWELYLNEGEIKMKDGTTLSFLGGFELGEIIKIDSIQLTNFKWYYFIEQDAVSDGYTHKIMNIYRFLTLDNDQILSIWFFGRNIKRDESDFFISIIETVKIR